jgi:hypothetical protein
LRPSAILRRCNPGATCALVGRRWSGR